MSKKPNVSRRTKASAEDLAKRRVVTLLSTGVAGPELQHALSKVVARLVVAGCTEVEARLCLQRSYQYFVAHHTPNPADFHRRVRAVTKGATRRVTPEDRARRKQEHEAWRTAWAAKREAQLEAEVQTRLEKRLAETTEQRLSETH